MVLAKIPYEKYGKMSEKERKDYSEKLAVYSQKQHLTEEEHTFFTEN